MNGNGWFFVGGLVGIVVTIVFELLIGFIFGLPSRGIEDVTPNASDVVAGHTGNVRIVPPAEYPHGDVVDIREREARIGMIGEKGPEAVIPLDRDSDGAS